MALGSCQSLELGGRELLAQQRVQSIVGAGLVGLARRLLYLAPAI
jgi:hypothetical protein